MFARAASTYDTSVFSDASGRRQREETDQDLDGVVDELRTFEWSDGEPLRLAIRGSTSSTERRSPTLFSP